MNQNQPNLHYSPFLVASTTMMGLTLLHHCDHLLPSSLRKLNRNQLIRAKERLLPPARDSKSFPHHVHLGVR
jgi:hypothetical protein